MGFLIYPLILAVFVSCSSINKLALKTTASVIHQGSDEMLTENNWHHFKNATPGNLKLLEGLWYSDQKNTKLLSLLIKGYGAYGYGVSETQALEDILLEKDNSFEIEQSLLFYQKAIFYGEKFLEAKGIKLKTFYDKSFPENLNNTFNSKLSQDDYIAVFYFAQSMGSSLNLQRTNVSKMGYMGHVQKMFNWVCSKKPDLERGSCQLFQAVFKAMTPSIMGGSQTVARKKFKDILKKQPYNLLAQMSYIQYHIIPMLEEDEFAVEMEKLRKKLNIWYNLQKGDKSSLSKIYQKNREFNLFNSIARERYKIINKVKKEIF